MSSGSSPSEVVLLLHGLGRAVQGASMRPLARRLRAGGFAVACLDYPSWRQTIDASEAGLRPRVLRAAEPFVTCHLVGHSLGGVLAGRLAASLPPGKLGRVVQIGAPNLGSPLAVLAHRIGPVRMALGPALADLGAPPPPACQGVGAIAGVTSWGPARFLPGKLGIPFRGESDGKVSLDSAHAGAARRAVLPVGHAFLPHSRRVAEAVAAYLREGEFPEAHRA